MPVEQHHQVVGFKQVLESHHAVVLGHGGGLTFSGTAQRRRSRLPTEISFGPARRFLFRKWFPVFAALQQTATSLQNGVLRLEEDVGRLLGRMAPGLQLAQLLTEKLVEGIGREFHRQSTLKAFEEGGALPAFIAATWRSPLVAPPYPTGRLVGFSGGATPQPVLMKSLSLWGQGQGGLKPAKLLWLFKGQFL
jgi:hypothetical protein